MARKIIDIGTIGNDGTGDSIRDSFNKVNDNFLELYSSLGLGEKLKFTGLSDTPNSYVGQENAVVTVNQTTDGLKFKQIVGGTGINIDQTSNANEIILNAAFANISGDKTPQLGGNLQAYSGGQQYRIQSLVTPITPDEATNKAYVDTKISKAGVNAVDPATGLVNESFGRMTGPLVLSRSPQPSDDITYGGLIAATKAYVDGSAFGSVANLYVATSGADARVGVSDTLQGRALAYAYRTIEAALKRAEEIILSSRIEIGPYKKILTYNNGAGNCTLATISTSAQSGTGFVGVALMSVASLKLNNPGTNYITGDILTITGGTGSSCTIKVLGTTATPGAIASYAIVSQGTYSVLPGSNTNVATTSNSRYGSGATFDLVYKVNSVQVTNGGSNYGLVSVRITGGEGSGAFGTANIVGGVIQSITVTDGGTGFTSQPTVVADLPTFAIYTAGFKTDFTGDYTLSTPSAIATRHVRTGMYLRGETSGALAQILAHTGVLDAYGNELFDVDIQYGTFQLGEVISFGDSTKNAQVTVYIESGIYEENYPLKVPQNVALIGDEFRRVIIKPKAGPSSSPWAFQNFRRDNTVDGLTTSAKLFGYHYLTDINQPVYPVIQNPGSYTSAAQLLYENKSFIQEEVIAWINYQISHNTSPFAPFTYSNSQWTVFINNLIDAITGDMVLGTNYLTNTYANNFLLSYNSNVISNQKEQLLTTIQQSLSIMLRHIANSGSIVTTSSLLTASVNNVVLLLETLTPYTSGAIFTNPIGIASDTQNAAAILQANRNFLQNEIAGYLEDFQGSSTNVYYNKTNFKNDVGYIVDAIIFDLLYGGNSAVIAKALSYWNNNASIVDTVKSLYISGLTQLKAILPYVISNQTNYASKSTSNTVTQVTNLTAASYSGTSAIKIVAETQIIIDVINVGTSAPSASPVVLPTFTAGVKYASNGADRNTIQTNKSTVTTLTLAWTTTTYGGTFTYDVNLCKRDVGLILDSIIFDLKYSGYARTISAALKYFQSTSALKAITLQLPQTLASMVYLNTVAQNVISNTPLSTVYNTAQTQVIDTAFVAESNSSNIITQLITAIQNIISVTGNLNPPKDNNKLDIFLCNDATMIRRVTCQGHGGFMMVLDPQGQILAKSPYCQESASFIGSTGRKQFAGGMFVDGFAGNLQVTFTAIDNSQLKISVAGLLRKPLLPASMIISGSSYRINYVRDYVYNALGSTATFVLDSATPYPGDVGPQTCTITTGITTIINKTNHGLTAGSTIVFSTTGTLPSGLSAGVPYYVLLAGIGANAFQITATIGSTVAVSTSGSSSGTIKYDRIYEVLAPGNRSMLSNDFTQVADLGYGVIVTNGGLTEAVSMFTYYCQISYYSINGGQIRSVAGSSAHGVYALVAEGSDPLEVPTPTDLYYQLSQAVTCYYPSSTYGNSTGGLIIYVNNYSYLPLSNGELEVDHGSGVLVRYPVNSAYSGSDLPTGVVRLTLGASTGITGLSGLYATVNNGTVMTLRQNQSLMLSGNLSGVAVRPSTGLILNEASYVYRVLQFNAYNDPNAPYSVSLTTGTPGVFTTAFNHGLLANYTVQFSSTGTLPGALSSIQTYYVLTTGITATTFQISTLKGGNPIAIPSAGTGQLQYTPTGITTTLLRENYRYINYTIYQCNDYATSNFTATATSTGTATSTSSSIATTTLTIGGTVTGTFIPGMQLSGGSLSATTPASFIQYQLTAANSATVTSTTAAGNLITLSTVSGIAVGQGIRFTSVTQTPTLTATTTSTFSSTGSNISGSTLTIGSVTGGTVAVGMILSGGTIPNGTYISANITGSGNGSTWTVSNYLGNTIPTQTSQAITGSLNLITVSSVTGIVPNESFVPSVTNGGLTASSTYFVLFTLSGTNQVCVANSYQSSTATPLSTTTGRTDATVFGSVFGNITANTQQYFIASISGSQITISTSVSLTPVVTLTNGAGAWTATFGVTTTYASGGAQGQNTLVVSSATGISAGMIVSGTGVPTGTFVSSSYVSGTTITLVNYLGVAQNLTAQASGNYTFNAAGTSGTYQISQSLTQSTTAITGTYNFVTVSSTAGMVPNSPIKFGTSVQIISTDGVYDYIYTNSTMELQVGMPVRFTGTTFGGLATNTTYYIKTIVSSNSFQISATLNGSVFDVSTGLGNCTMTTYATLGNIVTAQTYYVANVANGTQLTLSSTQGNALNVVTMGSASGSIQGQNTNKIPVTITIDSSNTTFTTPYAHGMSINDVIRVDTTGTLPTGLVNTSHYYVNNATTYTLTPALTAYGSIAGTSGTQSGQAYIGKVQGRAGDNYACIVPVSPTDELRVVGSTFNWKGQDYIVTRYDNTNSTGQAFARLYWNPINLYTGVQTYTGLAAGALLYQGAVTLKGGVYRGTSNASGTLTIRIALTRVTGHDLLEIGTGSYADTNYPHEIYGPAVNALAPGNETLERTVGRVFYVTTDQYGNFRVGPYFSVDQGTGKVTFSAAIALSNLDGLGFKRGVPIAEFSTDTSMTANAPDTVPVQSAIRGYIERRLGLSHSGAVIDVSQLIPGNGGFMALNGALAMKGNLDMNSGSNYRIVNLGNPVNPTDAVNLQSLTIANITGMNLTTPASANLATFTGVGNTIVNGALAGDVTLTLAGNTLTATISSSAIVDSKVSASAAIAQSKLSMQAAGVIASAPVSFTQSSLGLAAFDSVQFTATNGWITVKDNGLQFSKLTQISSNSVLGNSSPSASNVSSVTFGTVVDAGLGIKKSQYNSTGFLRKTGGTGSSDGDYSIVEMTASYTGTGDNGKLVQRDSNGDFGARNVSVSQLYVDSKLGLDTGTSGTGGYIRLYGYLGNGGVLVSDGSSPSDKQTLYWNNLHAFKTLDGISDAPITASQIQAQLLTSGSTTTQGQITGYWSLTAGSRLQSTYSADLAEYYEGDKEYEVGTVLVFGGEKEVTVTNKKADTRVAGVVSNTAGYIMYDACPGYKNLIALQGRVPCKVVGKISKGDLLVTSSISGVAVKAPDDVKVGTLVGKALQDYDSDHIGTIEIAVGRT